MSELKQTLAQARRFLLVSGVSFCIDLSIYWALATQAGFGSSWSKRISFLCITIWAFFAHKRFTFRHRPLGMGEPLRFALLYLTGWALNSAVHDLNAAHGSISETAFLLATLAWACWNFLGQKYFVFRKAAARGQPGRELRHRPPLQ